MPHHRVLPLQSTLRRVSTFVALTPRNRTLLSYTASFRPLLPFLWPAQNYHHLHPRHHERKLSTSSYRRANNIPDNGYGYEDDEMSKEGKKGGKGKGGNFQLKTPKGTRDWQGKDVVLREQIFSTITEVFKRHGGVTIDTPVFELRDTLTGKYGEDSKLIYDLADQGGEICSLRYDLTVPFARFLAQNAIQNIRRYHIAKVYRRDQPAMTKGRMREFYQCDFDIAGTYDPMLPDAEILRVIKEVFEGLPGWKGKFTIKINHRKILDGIFQICGVPEDKIRTISSAVDKLDKSPWEEVRKEMVDEKGLEPAIADKIWEYVQLKGGREIVTQLQEKPEVIANESAKAGLEDMALLCDYLSIFDVLPSLSIDMSLARGLDYYTGVIYEVVTEGSAPKVTTVDAAKKEKKPKKSNDPDADRSDDPTLGVGSVAAGGRYDKLVGMFSGKPIPCVGISFGVDRIFSITKNLNTNTAVRETEVEVLVMAFGSGAEFSGLLPERMTTVKQLWEAGIKAEYTWKAKPKWQKEFDYAKKEKDPIPWTVILGDEEEIQGMVKVKDMRLPKDHPERDGVLIEKAKLVEELKARLGRGEGMRLPKDHQEKDHPEKEHLEKERPEKERPEKERLEKDHPEKERLEKDHPEKERPEKDHSEKDHSEKDHPEKERLEKDHTEKERLEKDHPEKERLEKERLEKERLEKERLEKERLEKDHPEKERLEKNHPEKDHPEKERPEKDHSEKERLEKDHPEKERPEKDHLEKEHPEKNRSEGIRPGGIGVPIGGSKMFEELKARLARGKKTELPDQTDA